MGQDLIDGRFEDDDEHTRSAEMAMARPLDAMARSDHEAQLDAAHRYPRSLTKFRSRAIELATSNRDLAKSCMYALQRSGKVISGPSVRLAELMASAYGNLHCAARILGAEEREVIAEAVAWDLEANVRVTVQTRRRITKRNGHRYDDDMITVTGNAAASIALRNAIFRVIPKSFVDEVYGRAKAIAVGDAKTLAKYRTECVDGLLKLGVPKERIFARVEKRGIEDIGLDELEVLIALGTSIKSGGRTVDEAFPAPDMTPEKARDVEERLRAKSETKPERQPGEEG